MPAVYSCDNAFLRSGSIAGRFVWPDTLISFCFATTAGVMGSVPSYEYLNVLPETGLTMDTKPVPTFSEKRPQLALRAVLVFPKTSHATETRGTKLWNAVTSRAG